MQRREVLQQTVRSMGSTEISMNAAFGRINHEVVDIPRALIETGSSVFTFEMKYHLSRANGLKSKDPTIGDVIGSEVRDRIYRSVAATS